MTEDARTYSTSSAIRPRGGDLEDGGYQREIAKKLDCVEQTVETSINPADRVREDS